METTWRLGTLLAVNLHAQGRHRVPTKIHRKHFSLRGLRAFVAVARHLSFRTAAEELFVTASAVSHQIKTLEAELDVQLFERHHRTITLTDAGAALLADVGSLIDELDRVTSPYRDGHFRRALRLSVQPYFASEALMPKLAAFSDSHAEIDLNLDTTDEQAHHHPGSADASIRIFDRAPPGLVSDAFYPLRLIPGCSPALQQRLAATKDAIEQPFPMIVHSGRRQDWNAWAEASGLTLRKPTRLIELNSMVAVVNAACQGLGIALIPMPLSKHRFDNGELVQAHGFEYSTPDRYYFVSAPDTARTKPVQALRAWVLRTFAHPA